MANTELELCSGSNNSEMKDKDSIFLSGWVFKM